MHCPLYDMLTVTVNHKGRVTCEILATFICGSASTCFFCLFSPFDSCQVSCDRPLSLSLSVHLHVRWAAPARRRDVVLRDRAALGETHGSGPSTSLCRPPAQAAGVSTRACVGPAGVWLRTSAGPEGLHEHMGCPHTWGSRRSSSSCQQTWVHQPRTCKSDACFFLLIIKELSH